MKPVRITLFAVAAVAIVAASPAFAQSDAKAIEIAERVMEAMGGQEAWNNTRYISWNFMGRGRTHVWDKWTGNHRIEQQTRDGDRLVSLINTNTWNGRVWRNGVEVTDPEELARLLNSAQGAWINDTYWMFMPFKLRDPGVILEYVGEGQMEDGRASEILRLTFDNVGRTPNNRYLVHVSQDTGLVEQWSYFQNASDAEPGFTLPWADWQRFGNVLLSKDRGRSADWEIRVYDSLPESVFTSPDPIQR